MILEINTTDQYKIVVSLKEEKFLIKSVTEHNRYGSQVLLPIISNLLKEQGKSLQDLTTIQVATGPGSYTGIRVGVSVANGLGFALKIPVNGKEFETDINYV